MMNITFEFACQDDCLDKMVPSDLRKLVNERDQLKADNAVLAEAATAYAEVIEIGAAKGWTCEYLKMGLIAAGLKLKGETK